MSDATNSQQQSYHIHKSAKLHPTVILEGEVEIGEGTEIGPYCYLKGPIKIGKENRIHSHVVMGEPAEHRTKPGVGTIVIGDRNVIRELSVVQRGSGERDTQIGSDCYLMDHVHIAHDCVVEDGVTIAPNTVLAGHVTIQKGATVGVNTSIHQFSTIGSYAMIGMGSVIARDVPPLVVVSGNPARIKRLNTYQFTKLGVTEDQVKLGHLGAESSQAAVTQLLDRFNQMSRREKMSFK
jgi:UDP-N-acetylglucosamine acyltransferase